MNERTLWTPRVVLGGGVLLFVLLLSLITLPLTLSQDSKYYYDAQTGNTRRPPTMNAGAAGVSPVGMFGYDTLGRSILARSLLGGSISLMIGVAAAGIAVVLGTTVGLTAGYAGGWVDSLLMRSVDVLYGLPYILLVILFKIALENPMVRLFDWLQFGGFTYSSAQAANLVVMFLSIGLVSWLTMARVVRGQVLALRGLPFIEAARALGLPQWRIFLRHVLPNLVGPITVYATLAVPGAILQESFLSFLGVGVRLPLPTWGSLASDGVAALTPVKFYWWMLTFPCILLMTALLGLNFLGDGLRDVLDPKRQSSHV